MHAASLAEAIEARGGTASALARALAASRADTLNTFSAFEQQLPSLTLPYRATINPPVWELGHIGWFQEYWVARNPVRKLGQHADPDVARLPSLRIGADSLYNSSLVPHTSRWSLPLPSAQDTRADLEQQLGLTLALLERDAAAGEDLYFFRLALFHEDMHHEAALYMAQALGVSIGDPRWQRPELPEPPAPLSVSTGEWRLGAAPAHEFAFDNELGELISPVGSRNIDAQAVRWKEFLPFVESGGYQQPQWWTAQGWEWRTSSDRTMPLYLKALDNTYLQWRHGEWQALCLAEPACHLSCHEAEAWCRWAGRRLPTEAEWESAAVRNPGSFRWGDVWEWTSSAFAPFAGFVPHPYRDYSMPWFDGRPVLKGASFLTQARMRHPRYRNFFPAHRADVPAGFRSCAA